MKQGFLGTIGWIKGNLMSNPNLLDKGYSNENFYPGAENIPDSGVNDSYVQDGLILYLDGIKNTKSGHDISSKIWENLAPESSNRFPNGEIVGDLQWGDNCLNYGGQRGTGVTLNKTTSTFSEFTVEVVYRTNSIGSYDSLFQNCEGNGEGFQIESSANSNALTYIWYDSKLGYCRAPIQPATHNRILYTGFTRSSKDFSAYDTNLYSISGQIENSIKAGSVPWAVGAGPTTGSSKFTDTLNGSIYSVRVYDRKLSPEEIAKNRAIDERRFNCVRGAFEYTDESYFKPSSLMAQLDGINNTGSGHSNTATSWKNLVNNANCTMLGDSFTWGDNHLIFEGATKEHAVRLDSIYKPTTFTVETYLQVNNAQPSSNDWKRAFSCAQAGGWAGGNLASVNGVTMYFDSGKWSNFKFPDQSTSWDSLGFSYNPTTKKAIATNNGKYTTYDTSSISGSLRYNSSTYIMIGAEAGTTSYESGHCLDGNVYAFRLYNVALTDYQMAYNRKIDKARFNF